MKPRRGLLRRIAVGALAVYCCLLAAMLLLSVRMAWVTDHMYARLVKDPERKIPAGRSVVAPADGTVLYVKRFDDGKVPDVVKKGVAVPIADFTRLGGTRPRSGVLIGIYMNTFGVHINRAPISGRVALRRWYNGPHLDMTRLEKRLVVASMTPGPVFLKKLLGLAPHQVRSAADYVAKSARETLVLEGDLRVYVVRIADFYVGKILTWVQPGERVPKGNKIGMITWGSQTDVLIETESPQSLRVSVKEGEYVYAGESVLARY